MGDDLENRAESLEFQLIEGDASEFYGKYVALSGFNSRKIIASGKDAREVRKKACKKGVEEPLVFYVPDPDIDYIFNAA